MYTPLGVSSHIGPRQDSPPDEAQSSDLTSLTVVLDVCLRLPPEATVITCMNFDLPGASKREKDVCQYYIYIERPSRQRAEQVERAIERIASPWTGDYIWQDESFAVKIDSDWSLSGRTRFGDCIEDEWLIVWILVELSKQCADVFIRVVDTDGEFLLIESAMHLPRWLDPETASQRAWIRNGQFVIIEPDQADLRTRTCPELTLDSALAHLRDGRRVLHDSEIQEDAFARVRGYPEQSRRETHRVNCTLPRLLASILHDQPRLIAPASIECYNRDTLQASKFVERSSLLTLEEVRDRVTVAIRFTRTLYAQIVGAKFTVPTWYAASTAAASTTRDARPNTEEFHALETGCKVTCGFELLAMSSDSVLKRIKDARRGELPDDETIRGWAGTVDSDAYLNVNFDELEKVMMAGQKRSGPHPDSAGRSGNRGTTDDSADATVKKMVDQMQKFMNTESTFEGAEFSDEEGELGDEDDDGDEEDDDDMDSEDEGFDDEEMNFMNFLRSSVTGKSAIHALNQPAAARDKSDGDTEDEENEEDEESVGDLREYMSAMDAELSSHGLSSVVAPTKSRDLQSTVAAATGPLEGAAADEGDVDVDDDDDDEELRIDFALAKNMLESMKSQGGMEGPAAGLLGRMGISVPRDDPGDDDDDDDDEPRQDDLD